jgi:putative hydrolase of the HAD superfamily
VPLAIFDLDNTLIDRAATVRLWARDWVDRYRLDPAEVAWLIDADGDGFVPRPLFMAAVRDRYGLAEPVDTLLTRFRAQIVDLVDPDPTVTVALNTLRRAGWRIAIATNGATDQQWAKIRRTGLDQHTDAVAVSEEVGANKPDPLMFQVAARRCGARLADGGWMVGDCATRDIAGGQGVGLGTIWIRRDRTWDTGTPPDAIVDHVHEAATILLADTTTAPPRVPSS